MLCLDGLRLVRHARGSVGPEELAIPPGEVSVCAQVLLTQIIIEVVGLEVRSEVRLNISSLLRGSLIDIGG